MNNSMNLNKKTFFVVSGASRGIGQRMAIECAKKFKSGSVILLLARSETRLEQTKLEIYNETKSKKMSVFTKSIDLRHPTIDEIQNCFEDALKNKSIDDFELAFIIHNVGTIGNIKKYSKQMNDISEWREYFDMNVFSVAVLNSIFIERFENCQKFIVNVTSLLAVEPYKATGFYCSGKAAREMYFRTLALEEKEILVLNYSPGPVDTDMVADLETNSGSTDVQNIFSDMRKNKTILTTNQTTEKFLQIIEKGIYKSGDHVDYFD